MTPIDRRHVSYLGDYCGHCNPAGDQADSCVRLSTLMEPDAVTWDGDRRVMCEYVCDHCGYQWTRSDLWSAEQAGFDHKQKRRPRDRDHRRTHHDDRRSRSAGGEEPAKAHQPC